MSNKQIRILRFFVSFLFGAESKNKALQELVNELVTSEKVNELVTDETDKSMKRMSRYQSCFRDVNPS